MIEKLEPLQGLDHSWLNKINELVDAVNKLETMAKNTNTVLESLIEENNIHEKQIDELQMKIEPEKCETPAETAQQVSYMAPGDITVFHGFNCSVEFDIPLPKGTRITIKSITKGGDNE